MRDAMWTTARGGVRCAFGHAIAAGEPVRYGQHGSALCAPCAKEYYQLEPPAERMTAVGELAADFKLRQSGEKVGE